MVVYVCKLAHAINILEYNINQNRGVTARVAGVIQTDREGAIDGETTCWYLESGIADYRRNP